MNILHVYNYLDPRNGGPPQMIASLARAEVDLGHEVVLLSQDDPADEASRRFLQETMGRLPPRVFVAARLPVATPSEALRIRGAVRGADVVHIHGLWPVAGLLVGRECRRQRRPYVVTAHGMLHPEALAQHGRRKRVGLRALGYARLLAGAAAVHFLNPIEAQRAVGLRRPARSATIPNGVFPEQFAAERPAGRARAKIPGLGDAPFVLYLARLHRQKGPDLLADAFRRVADRTGAHLVVAGPDQGARADFERRVAAYAGRVHLLGPVYGDDKWDLLRDAAVFCLPSRQEGFSVGITEALATGTPCVVTDACNFPEVATEGCGAVVPLDAEALARGLLDVLRDPEAARAMGRRGRALVLSRYTWPRIAEQMLALYAEVVGR